MRVSEPNKLLKAVAFSILGVVAALYISGGSYSFQEPAGFVWNKHIHAPVSCHSTHHHYPINFFSALISETVEEIDDDDNQESKKAAVKASEAFFTLPAYYIPSKKVVLPRLRQLVLNRPSVLLFILYHSWKSFLF